jgi:hypothetical protein
MSFDLEQVGGKSYLKNQLSHGAYQTKYPSYQPDPGNPNMPTHKITSWNSMVHPSGRV